MLLTTGTISVALFPIFIISIMILINATLDKVGRFNILIDLVLVFRHFSRYVDCMDVSRVMDK